MPSVINNFLLIKLVGEFYFYLFYPFLKALQRVWELYRELNYEQSRFYGPDFADFAECILSAGSSVQPVYV
jgi:hypothetical protein